MNHEFPWQQDAYGEYLTLRLTDERTVEMREENTVMFIYAGKLAMFNHVWVQTEDECEDEDNVMGIRIWQQTFDRALGRGAFDCLCNDLMARGWAMADEDEPSELDRQAYIATFPENITYDEEARKAAANLDAEWLYYSQEPGWQV